MEVETPSAAAIERTIVQLISAACRLEPATVDSSTRLLDAYVDSLTLVAVLSQLELVCGTTFDADTIAEMLRLRDVGELVAAVTRRLERAG
jgi:acyl carrier protein